MNAQQEKLDSISNNIANVNTEGYKRVDVNFKDLVYENLNRTGYPVSEDGANSSLNGTGVRAGEWMRDNKQGNLTETGKSTNLAIDGEGYFQVVLPQRNQDGIFKTAFTRSGSFNVDGDGNIVDSNGNRLDITFDENTTLEDRKFTEDNFIVNEQGTVIKKEGSNFREVGKINLYNVVSPDSLQSVGNSLYVIKTDNINGLNIPVERPYLVQDSSIRQKYLELSNVDIAKEMTDMIMAQRTFELNSRAMKTGDEMWGMTNNLRSK